MTSAISSALHPKSLADRTAERDDCGLVVKTSANRTSALSWSVRSALSRSVCNAAMSFSSTPLWWRPSTALQSQYRHRFRAVTTVITMNLSFDDMVAPDMTAAPSASNGLATSGLFS